MLIGNGEGEIEGLAGVTHTDPANINGYSLSPAIWVNDIPWEQLQGFKSFTFYPGKSQQAVDERLRNIATTITDTTVIPEEGILASMLSQGGITQFNASACVDSKFDTLAWDTDASVAGAFIRVDLAPGNEQAFTKVRIYKGSTGSYAGSYDIQYSDNGTSW